ncbi:sodium:proton antiporter [Paenibacillus sp. J31TS4]|uniref:cation:proton antiporter n=1 Tax=Paenibacillus sp. J31TS4 TaxID=2807195 RepID=UPI001B13F9E1|nr:cation:proton antiporter [Paenibacillus sp. J31TS4]GIP39451.1 sodium:proton antiporter [Paenibacillus sp. J31TS4]
MELILQLAIIIICTKLAGDWAVRLGQPSVLGKLIVGVLIGPAVLNWVQSSSALEAFSEIGVLLLMFFAGLETDLKDLNENRNASVAVALGGIVLPLAAGYVSGLAIGMDMGQALFLGLLLSATSVSISVQTFKELGQMKSRESTTVLGAALVDDIVVVVALAILMSVLTTADVGLGLVIGKKVLFFVLIALLGWKAVPWLMRKLAPLQITEPVLSIALAICLFFSFTADYFGVAGIIGAFAAGIAISQTEFKHEVEKRLEPVAYTIFVPVFFVSIGLNVTFAGLSGQLPIIVLLSVVAILSKLAGSGLGAKLTGFGWHSSVTIGAGMISRGEVALILAAIGMEAGLLLPSYFTTIVIVVIVSTMVTPPLLKYLLGRKQQPEAAGAGAE